MDTALIAHETESFTGAEIQSIVMDLSIDSASEPGVRINAVKFNEKIQVLRARKKTGTSAASLPKKFQKLTML